MHRHALLLTLACSVNAAHAGSEHFDALIMIDPDGALVTGLVDVDNQMALASERRIFDATFDIIPLGGGFEASTTDVPGFNALLPSNPSLPSGYSTLQPSSPVSFVANALEIGEVSANLLFWDGTGAPAFTPSTVPMNISKAPNVLFSVDLDGSASDVPGFVIDIADSSGGLHKHVDYTINNSQFAPRGFYLWSFTLSTDTQDAAPIYFVHALGAFDQDAYDEAVAYVEDTFLSDQSVCQSDFNSDDLVDIIDFGVFGSAFGSMTGDLNYNDAADFNNDGLIDIIDFGVFGAEFGSTTSECVG